MKIKITKNCKWAQLPWQEPLVFKVDQIVEISVDLANDIIKSKCGIKYEDKKSDQKIDKYAKTKMVLPEENKMWHSEENKTKSARKRGRPRKS